MKKELTLILYFSLFICVSVKSQKFAFESPVDSNYHSKKGQKVEISGFIQTHFIQGLNTNKDTFVEPSRFRILRARLTFSGKINKYADFSITIDPRSPLITGVLREAYIDLKFIPHQVIRVGEQKTQFGYENVESSTNLYCVNRSELSESIGRGVNLRDIGIGLIGKFKINQYLKFEDAFTLVNGQGLNPPGFDDFNHYCPIKILKSSLNYLKFS